MSIRRMTLGAGYRYLMSSVARLDESGKSTTMAGVRTAWEATFGHGWVIGLAPSAAAAEVLADAVGVPSENTAKWISENQHTPDREQRLRKYAARLAGAYPSVATRQLQQQAAAERAAYRHWTLRPGQLVIIDEASMAATTDLDHIITVASRAGAKVLLVGDWAQLSPVQAGGAFELLADDRGDDAPTLHDVRRFRHEWERDASLQLRVGSTDVANTYIQHGRVKSGTREDMLDLLFDGWLTDTRAGRHSLMIATDAQTVADLNARARGHRVVAGEVAGAGVAAAEGSTVGVGDVVVTRLNVRAMSTGRSWVKHGDEWIVRDARDDGSLLVTRAGTGESATLSADYVGKQVELGYASTAHRAQGRTSDTAHAYITDAITREPLYVMATRGRESNNLYVGTPYDPNGDTHPASTADGDPVDVLRAAIEKPGADQSANEVLRAEVRARSRQQLLHPDHISGLDGAGITR